MAGWLSNSLPPPVDVGVLMVGLAVCLSWLAGWAGWLAGLSGRLGWLAGLGCMAWPGDGDHTMGGGACAPRPWIIYSSPSRG